MSNHHEGLDQNTDRSQGTSGKDISRIQRWGFWRYLCCGCKTDEKPKTVAPTQEGITQQPSPRIEPMSFSKPPDNSTDQTWLHQTISGEFQSGLMKVN
jgi:hypothetical protein